MASSTARRERSASKVEAGADLDLALRQDVVAGLRGQAKQRSIILTVLKLQSGSGDAVNRCIHTRDVSVIESIESISGDDEVHLFADVEAFFQTQVHVRSARHLESVRRQIGQAIGATCSQNTGGHRAESSAAHDHAWCRAGEQAGIRRASGDGDERRDGEAVDQFFEQEMRAFVKLGRPNGAESEALANVEIGAALLLSEVEWVKYVLWRRGRREGLRALPCIVGMRVGEG